MRVVELDCDGVLLDVGTAALNSKYGELMRGINLTIEDASTYDLSNFPPVLKNNLYAAFADPEVIRTVKPYTGVLDALSRLYLQTMHKADVHFVIRSGIMSEAVREAKQEVINALLQDTVGVGNPRFDIELVCLAGGAKKEATAPFVLVEDCPENLIESKAKHKILVNHGYNTEKNYPELMAIDYLRIKEPKDICNAVMSFVNAYLE